MPRKDFSFWVAYSLLTLLIALRLLPLAIGFEPLWGVAQLIFLPGWFTFVYCVLGAVALILPLLPLSAQLTESLTGRFSSALYGSQSGAILRIAFVIVLGTLFWLLSAPTHFLGDGYPYIANLGGSIGHWVKWTEGSTMRAVLAIQPLLGGISEPNAAQAFRVISVLAGMASVWFFLLIARVISERPVIRFLTFVTLTLTPTSLLFFGYVESYPLLWAPVSGLIYFGLRYTIDGKHLGWALVCLVLATVAHLQAIMFYPALMFLVFSRGKGLEHLKRYRAAVLASAGVVAIAAIGVFVHKCRTDISFENFFLWPFTGKPIDPATAIFSPAHLLDIFNLILLVSPLFLMFALLTEQIRSKLRTDRATAFLATSSAACLAFLFVIDPSLSMPRDWDLFAICLLPLTIMVLRLLPENRIPSLHRLGISLGIAAFIFTLPYLMVNLNTERSINYIKTIIDTNPQKSMGSMAIVGIYYRNLGDKNRSDSVFITMKNSYPNLMHMRRCRQLIAEGKLAEAEQEFGQIVPDPFWKDYHLCLTDIYNAKGQFDSALAHVLTAIQLQQYYDQSYITLGYTYMLRDELDKAIGAFRIGYSLNSKDQKLLVNMATVQEWQGHHDSTLFYARQLYQLDSTSDQASCLLARSYYYMGDRQQARHFARRYFDLGRTYPEYGKLKAELISLMPELAESPKR